MRKKLQTYYGVVAYKADKTPIKRAFHGRSKADAKARYFTYLAEHGPAERPNDLYTRAVATFIQAAVYFRSCVQYHIRAPCPETHTSGTWSYASGGCASGRCSAVL